MDCLSAATGDIVKAWEIHPVLIHFPLAFLLSGIALDLWALARPGPVRTRAAAGLLVAGVASGWLAAPAGLLAYFTVPHAEDVHALMIWHPVVALTSLLLFTWLAVHRWKTRALVIRGGAAWLGLFAAVLLSIAGFMGGRLVYRGAVGITLESLERPVAPQEEEPHVH